MPEDEETIPQEEHTEEPEQKEAQEKSVKKKPKHKTKHKAKTPLPPPKAPKRERSESAGNSGLALIVIYVLLGLLVIATSFYTGYLFGKTGGSDGTDTQTGSGSNEKLQIVEYSDFQCPFCTRAVPTVKQIKETYGDKVEVVYKHFPLESIHPDAMGAAIASECARDQGKFWEYHDKLFANQGALGIENLKTYAKDLGLDTAKFNDCLDNKKTEARVQADIAEASSRGLRGTPSFWIKDELVVGALPFETFQQKIDEKLSGKAAAPAPAPQEQALPPAPNVPKTAKPKVELFVMSYCPFGLQMEKAYAPVAELLGSKADMQIHYVSYIMHGEEEAFENLRQYCIQKEQPSKYLAYLKCFVEATDSEGCLVKAGVDTSKMQTCFDAADNEFDVKANLADQSSWLSGRYPQFNLDKTLTDKYEVGGSPTLIINGVEANVARSQEALKQAICNAFTTPPAECNTALNTNQENPGAGAIGAGTQAAGNAVGGCG